MAYLSLSCRSQSKSETTYQVQQYKIKKTYVMIFGIQNVPSHILQHLLERLCAIHALKLNSNLLLSSNLITQQDSKKSEKDQSSVLMHCVLFADVTILLSLTVFLNRVSETMPATSDAVPLISMRAHLEKSSLFFLEILREI